MTKRFPARWIAVAATVLSVAALASPARAALANSRRTIAWHECRTGPEDETGARLDAVGARCGEVTVPLDYRDPDGRTISVAVARRAATDPVRRRGTLFLNAGGPGPSLGAVALLAAGEPPDVPHGSPVLAAQYDLVAIDPRFFGRSTPLECGWPIGRYLRSVQFASPDRRAFDGSVAAAKDLADRCTSQRGLLPHASTRDIARDIDVVRAELGERRISYLGWSYGTYLGAVYLQMFPRHVDRIVLDSALDPDTYGPSATRETAAADAAALADWATWASIHNGQYGLGDTPARVLSTVAGIAEAAARRPLRVGDHRIDAAMLPGLLLTAVDTDAFYAELSAEVRVLADAARGRTVTPTPVQEQRLALYTSQDVIAEFGFSANYANKCADRAASRDPETYYRDIQAHRDTEPFFGSLARQITPCAFWPTSPVEAPTRIGNDHPALVVGASGDPAAPYPGQRAMHRALTGSRMVTLDGAFRHGVYLYDGTACVDDAVEDYLLDGVLPAADVTCARPAGPGPTRTR